MLPPACSKRISAVPGRTYVEPDAAEIRRSSVAALTAMDQLGRRVSTVGQKKSAKKYVGIFYFTWLGQHPEGQRGNFDITRLHQKNPQALFNTKGTPESPLGQYHFWGEPLYGYYDSTDPWIIMRHIELLTMSGIDYLMLDATNSYFYPAVVNKLLSQLNTLQQEGWEVPKLAFYTNSHSGSTVNHIYQQFYSSGKYADIWFKPEGKPLIVGISVDNKDASDQTVVGGFTNYVSDEMKSFFDLRESQWPTGKYNEKAFPWISWVYPQLIQNQVLSVSVAQHSPVNIVFSDTVNTRGRGYDGHTRQNNKAGIAGGLNFENQWKTAFANESGVSNIFVTGWNEWIAIKNANAGGVFFVDGFNQEFSRDIEMMKGGYADNYYLQLLRNARRFKYSDPTPHTSSSKTIQVASKDLSQWSKVRAHYKDFNGDAMPRNYQNFSGTGVYTDRSNRNDITDIRVANDEKNLYILVQTKEPITPYNGSDLNWMNIFISGSENAAGFAGFSYVLNRRPQQNITPIEKSLGGYRWEQVGTAKYDVFDNNIQFSIPLRSIGQKAGKISIALKVTDNVTNYSDIMDYYVSGDSAPIGRLGFAYNN
jgi:hypothetical protein